MARIGAHSFRGSHLSGGAKGVTALLADLKAVAEDGGGDILNVTVGNYNWGSTATAKLLQLVPKLEVINLKTSKKVSQHHNLMDWTAAKFLKSFTYECESCGTRSDKAVSFLCRLPRRPARVSSATGCYDVDSASVRNLVRTHNLLECLSLSNIEGMGETSGRSGMSDEVLFEIGHSCTHLSRLVFAGDLRFTDGGILTLLSGCPMLTDLTLSTVTIFHKTLSVVSLGAPGLAALNKARAARGLRVSISGYVVNEDNELVKATMSLKRPAPVSTEALIVD